MQLNGLHTSKLTSLVNTSPALFRSFIHNFIYIRKRKEKNLSNYSLISMGIKEDERRMIYIVNGFAINTEGLLNL